VPSSRRSGGTVHRRDFTMMTHSRAIWVVYPAQPPVPVSSPGSASCRADPQPVAVRVVKLDLAPVGLLTGRRAELGQHRGDIAHKPPDESVGPGASVLGQEQPCPAPGNRHERGPVRFDAMPPLLSESQVPYQATAATAFATRKIGIACSSMRAYSHRGSQAGIMRLRAFDSSRRPVRRSGRPDQ
jgi:hypothetical protein